MIWGLMVCFVFSGVGFGAYCAVDFALVMDVLPDDREKAKDLAVWHQVTHSVFKHLNSYTVFPVDCVIKWDLREVVLCNDYLLALSFTNSKDKTSLYILINNSTGKYCTVAFL